MFDSLTTRLGDVFDRLRGRGALTEADVDAALREVRVALIEADVALPVVRDFIDKVRAQALGEDVIRSVTPGQQVVKIVHDVLVETLRGERRSRRRSTSTRGRRSAILMVGLQGSGKTTTSAKIALRLKTRERKKVLMASLDVQRPAAQEQLAELGEQAGVADPADRRRRAAGRDRQARASMSARREGYDVVILDTAGRLHIDEELMVEVAAVARRRKPHETLLVADAMTGQDAVNIAKASTSASAHRHRAHPRRRRRARRRGAFDARGHRRADQVHRHRRKARRARAVPSRAHRRPHPRHGRRRQPGREGGRDHRQGRGREARRAR